MAKSSAALPDLPNKPGAKNWVEKAGGLPPLITRTAKHLRAEKGYTVSRAIATAVNWAKKMCATGTAFGGKAKVSAKAQAAACKAIASWNTKRGKSKLSETINLGLVEALCEPDELAELQDALALLESGALDEKALADLADFPLTEAVTELEADGELASECPLDLTVDVDLPLTEAAAKAPMSHAKRRSGESLTSWGKRLKAGDAALERKRDGSAKNDDFEKKHPRGRAGQWTIAMGAKGEDVKLVQRKVGAKTDGKYGAKTKAAVRRFQKERGIKVDGIVGAQTLAEMRHEGAGKRVTPGAITKKQWERKDGKKDDGKKKRGRALPGKLVESPLGLPLIESFNSRQPRDRMGRWREVIGKFRTEVDGLTRTGQVAKLPDGTKVRASSPGNGYTILLPDGGQKNAMTKDAAAAMALDASAQSTAPNSLGGSTPYPTVADALAGTGDGGATVVPPTPSTWPDRFEEIVGQAVKGMKGSRPNEKGDTPWRRQAFLTVRTALGRHRAGISLENDEDWKTALAWWEDRGRKMLREDWQMRDWLSSFNDDPVREMLREVDELRETPASEGVLELALIEA